ncbi:MAG: DUF2062 domain-containing protein [Desulforhopalus sp.]|nr:DUF2062 domain-containing protein [Desulforhopalus sp.]
MNRELRILIAITVVGNGEALPAVAEAALTTGYKVLVVSSDADDDCMSAIAGLPCNHIRSKKGSGRGDLLLLAAEHASQGGYDTLITIDGADQCNPADLQLLVDQAKSHAEPCLVVGARPMYAGETPPPGQGKKAPANFWVRLETGMELPDAHSTFRLYPVKQLLAQELRWRRTGFAIEAAVKLAWSGVAVFSVPLIDRQSPAENHPHRSRRIVDALELAFLHTQLLCRRLLPLPHKRLADEPPLPKKVMAGLSQNPFTVLKKICSEHTSPFWLAMAVWLGIFMGALPLLAVHTIAIIYVAHRLHVNIIAAVAASQFCMPPVMPVLCIQMGYYLRNGEFLMDFSWQPWLLGIHERLWEWLIGSLLLGPFFGFIGGGIMYWMASRLQKLRETPPKI